MNIVQMYFIMISYKLDLSNVKDPNSTVRRKSMKTVLKFLIPNLIKI